MENENSILLFSLIIHLIIYFPLKSLRNHNFVIKIIPYFIIDTLNWGQLNAKLKSLKESVKQYSLKSVN